MASLTAALMKCKNCEFLSVFLSVIQFGFCSFQLTRTEKQKILKRQKYSKQERAFARKRKTCYAELEPVKKKLRLDTAHRYYNDEKQRIVSGSAEKYKSMSASTKDNLVAKGRQAYEEMGSTEKEKNVGKKEERKKQCNTVKSYYAQ